MGDAGANRVGGRVPWDLLPLLPLGILAGLLSGLLGIGGGLIFSPLLLWIGLSPHQALATSTLAIVPTTLGGSWAHLRSRAVPTPALGCICGGAIAGSLVFSQAGNGLQGWQLLALQGLMYAVIAVVIRPPQDQPESVAALPLAGLAAVGLVAGWSSGLLGVGGGLVMVPLMVQGLKLRVYQAIRLSPGLPMDRGAAAARERKRAGVAAAGAVRAAGGGWPAPGRAAGAGLVEPLPEAAIQFETEHRRHLLEVAAGVEPMAAAPVIQQEEPMGHPQLQAVGGEANPLGAAELMRQQHRHVTGERAIAAIQQ